MEGVKACFNSRAHGARDPDWVGCDVMRAVFQFTRARGARPPSAGPDSRTLHVSIHARTGRATSRGGGRSPACGCFNSRAHGARDEVLPDLLQDGGFQFTRARGARPPAATPAASPSTVSIHARTGRATGAGNVLLVVVGVSIHARTGRATSRGGRGASPAWFQFTRARGARPGRFRRMVHAADVSIHARTGRATTGRRRTSIFRSFNSRAHGARDLTWTRDPGPGPGFNSRAHGARDSSSQSGGMELEVSIHARTGRATVAAILYWHHSLFQFTRARGARQTSAPSTTSAPKFQFTRARGARHRGRAQVNPLVVSIHARTGRATHAGEVVEAGRGFQFTRARGARLLRSKDMRM